MDAQALQSLPRAELQQLAKSHRVKANAKSAIIIERLLKLFPAGVPHATMPTPKRPRRSSVEQREDVLPVIKPETQAARTRSTHGKLHVNTIAETLTFPAEAHAPPSQPQATPAQVVASPAMAHVSPTEAFAPSTPVHISPTLAEPSFKRPQADAPPPPATIPRASTSRQRQKMDKTIFPLRHSDFTPFAYTTPRPGRGIPAEPQSDHSPVYTPQNPLPSAFHSTDDLQPGLLSPFTTPPARAASASTKLPGPGEARFGQPFPVDKEEAAKHADSVCALLEQIGDQAARVPDLRARHASLKESVREQRRQLRDEKALRIQLDSLLAYARLAKPEPDAHEKTDIEKAKESLVKREIVQKEESIEDTRFNRPQQDGTKENSVETGLQYKEESIQNKPMDQAQKEETEDEWSKRILRRARSPLSSVKRKLSAVRNTQNHPPSPPRTPSGACQKAEEYVEAMREVREDVTEEFAVARALETGLFPSEPEPLSPRYLEDFDGEVRRRTLHRLSQGDPHLSSLI